MADISLMTSVSSKLAGGFLYWAGVGEIAFCCPELFFFDESLSVQPVNKDATRKKIPLLRMIIYM